MRRLSLLLGQAILAAVAQVVLVEVGMQSFSEEISLLRFKRQQGPRQHHCPSRFETLTCKSSRRSDK